MSKIGIAKKGLGVIFHPNPFTFSFKVGYIINKSLEGGTGRYIKDNGDVYDGYWENSLLERGYKYYKAKNHYVQLVQNQTVINEGFNFPASNIIKMRQELHTKSKFFIDKISSIKNLHYINQFKLLSQEDYQSAVFVKKTQRSSVIGRSSVIAQPKNEIQNTQNLVESSLSLIKKNNYLFEIPKFETKTNSNQPSENPSVIEQKQDTTAHISDQNSPNQSPVRQRKDTELNTLRNSANMSSVKAEEPIALNPSIKSLAISNNKLSQIDYPQKQQTNESMIRSKSSLRQTFQQISAPPDLRSKIFEPFSIVNFEDLRKNTSFMKEEQSEPQSQDQSRRSRKKIFSVDHTNVKSRYMVDVQAYNQFLEVSGLNQENDPMFLNY